jgi:hypothetical protein
MNWVRLILLNVLVIADFFCATLIVARIVESVPEVTFPGGLLLAIWFLSLAVGAVVIIVIWRRLRSSSDSS